MKTVFEENYEELRTYDEARWMALDTADQELLEQAKDAYTMKTSEIQEKGDAFQEIQKFYNYALENGNARLDFHDLPCQTIKKLANVMKENGIEEFTISMANIRALQTAAEFCEEGYQVIGMTQVMTKYAGLGDRTEYRAALVLKS